ncbi:hypothetical protein [Deinococcus soli (ex Cha et al. 2016)]|uniref:hypothetical protein n=1 Tax=Deinococcus soli (ex Cha et al. 2016) TaxID=1309411 RepID=UPI00166E3E0E|nr:hypothetical protein [Deinococcus soli (ex Cha et al. 2016)]GGB83230.1 hypothetical protein GCM10008019_44180 [Deinococcus soli (ex Cha et al. 2016)]
MTDRDLALTPAGIEAQIRAAGFHPQRIVVPLDVENALPEINIVDWAEFCATARALGVPVLFYEAEPFKPADFPPIGGRRQPLWEILPEAAWLKAHVGDIPTVIFYGFFPGGVLEHQADADWWNRTEGLWEKAEQVGAAQRREQNRREWEAFEEEVKRVMPQDELFRQIALLPRPSITDLRNRVAQVFPKQRVSAMNLLLNNLVKTIKAEEKQKKAEAKQKEKAKGQ